ncbi:MAG: hypothetical protein EXR99_09570 [Gemmataceae bacterium]|nr:hypothetical protein [Gemmataceae bacterium]
MRWATFLLILFLLPGLARGQDADVVEVFKKFEQAKPLPSAMGFYSLDWVCTLPEAKIRAQKEKRPILVILNTNISAHCNLYSGHT